MSQKYSIIVKEPRGEEVELCRVDSNPEAIAKAARSRIFRIGKKEMKRYDYVRVIEIKDGVRR
jgi:hypothetical protein